MRLLWRSNAVFRINSIKAYKHWLPSRNLTIESGIKGHIPDMWHMTLMWMVHAVIINEIWHSGVLLLICTKTRTFIGQNKSTVLILHPGFRIFRAIRSFVTCQWKPTTQLSVKFLAICQLTPSIPSFIVQELFPRPSGQVFHSRRYLTRFTNCGFLSGQHTERFDRPGWSRWFFYRKVSEKP